MGVSMICRVRALCALAIAAAVSLSAQSLAASAADLPQVKLSERNTVPACATPGRLMSFLESRTKGQIDPRFQTIAADYMRVGEELNIRWDIAFFQMMLETGNLSFTGDVSASQNNFVGLGATGKNVPGESFADVATGVKAHLQHLLLYAGETVDNPVADRTRKVQEWGVLNDWKASLKGPVNYAQLVKKWAPGSRTYAREVSNLAESFYGSPCRAKDPNPEMLALGRPGSVTQTAASDDASASGSSISPSGAELARRAVAEARASGSFLRSGLGAGSLIDEEPKVAVGEPADNAASAEPASPLRILNAEPDATAAAAVEPVQSAPPRAEAPVAESKSKRPAKAVADVASEIADEAEPKKSDAPKVKIAAAGAGTKGVMSAIKLQPPPASRPSGCKVWTASYGGARSVIIRARADSQDNYTVLDVNEGLEKREADAYIAAYARGGVLVGEFTNSSQALDKAFELCPEG